MLSFSKKLFCVLLISLLFSDENIFGQNLVDNPSFENAISCPDSLNQVYKAAGWFSTRPSPDYFNSCNTDTGFSITNVSVPRNYWGYQFPGSGNAYIGLTAKSGSGNVRECIGGKLLSNLIIGKKYFVSLKVSLALNNFPYLCAVNKLGVLFSTQDYSINSNVPICNCSQIFTDSIITDTLNWVLIKGSFISDSTYSYLNIGNFFDDLNTDSIQIFGTFSRAYYYIDDICVSTDSLYCEQWTGLSEDILKEKISIFPNPSTSEITIENIPWGCKNITIYNLYGIEVKSLLINGNFKTTINVSNFSSGIYFLNFKLKNKIIHKTFIQLNN